MGSFDPIHKGHIKIAKHLALELDEVLIVPLYDAPHKQGLTNASHRLNMCQLACRDLDRINVSTAVIDHHITGYDLDLIRVIKELYKEDDLYYILGSDVYLSILTWPSLKDLVKLVDFYVIIRDKSHMSRIQEISDNLQGQTREIFIEEDKISSTRVKEDLKANKVSQDIDDLIYSYIKKNKLYQL